MIGIIAPVLAVEQFVDARDGVIQSLCVHPAGQGVNVARAVCELGEACTIVGFAGGESGIVLRGLLVAYRLGHTLIPTRAETAAVLKVTRGPVGQVSLALGNPTVSRHEADDFYSAASLLVMECAAVVLSSVLAKGMPTDFYARLVRLAHRYRVKTIVDVPPELFPETLAAAPTVIKPNVDQLRPLYGLGHHPKTADLLGVADDLRAKGAEAVVLSMGEDGALVVGADGAWRVTPPPVEAVVEAGAGDCMIGGIAVGIERGRSLVDATQLGAAAGAAKVMRHGLGSCKRPVTERLCPRVRVRRLRRPSAMASHRASAATQVSDFPHP